MRLFSRNAFENIVSVEMSFLQVVSDNQGTNLKYVCVRKVSRTLQISMYTDGAYKNGAYENYSENHLFIHHMKWLYVCISFTSQPCNSRTTIVRSHRAIVRFFHRVEYDFMLIFQCLVGGYHYYTWLCLTLLHNKWISTVIQHNIWQCHV